MKASRWRGRRAKHSPGACYGDIAALALARAALPDMEIKMTASDDEDIKTTDSRVVYENRWMRVREDAVTRRDSSQGIYGVVEKAGFVTIAVVDAGRVHLVQQYRYLVRGRYWELPQGSWE